MLGVQGLGLQLGLLGFRVSGCRILGFRVVGFLGVQGCSGFRVVGHWGFIIGADRFCGCGLTGFRSLPGHSEVIELVPFMH